MRLQPTGMTYTTRIRHDENPKQLESLELATLRLQACTNERIP